MASLSRRQGVVDSHKMVEKGTKEDFGKYINIHTVHIIYIVKMTY